MEILEQLCIKSYEVKDVDGNCWKAVQGKIYTTSLPKDNQVVVLSNYWVTVPADHFVRVER